MSINKINIEFSREIVLLLALPFGRCWYSWRIIHKRLIPVAAVMSMMSCYLYCFFVIFFCSVPVPISKHTGSMIRTECANSLWRVVSMTPFVYRRIILFLFLFICLWIWCTTKWCNLVDWRISRVMDACEPTSSHKYTHSQHSTDWWDRLWGEQRLLLLLVLLLLLLLLFTLPLNSSKIAIVDLYIGDTYAHRWKLFHTNITLVHVVHAILQWNNHAYSRIISIELCYSPISTHVFDAQKNTLTLSCCYFLFFFLLV